MKSTRLDRRERGIWLGSGLVARGSVNNFVSSHDVDNEIFVVKFDGSNLHQIIDNSDKAESPAWPADSPQLTFSSDRDCDLEIYVINVDGSDVRQLTDNDVVDEAPAWLSVP